ncbi:hypothetical protein MU859_02560 [Lactobacillus kefiranofaciens subsp. kefirgranum]|uniref:hypothetical protein n=1 Tax=Lactobacillus kefiranofaciens TaxID=267818 RepID=UPI002030BE00|nr:hypothetical protein [Lactobacillus kefiranofaciens]URW71811.1 hypothetical protein MU859_02560 [Lactobacillus kefiranofaciens subsp. kefirgranum]
MAINAVIDSKDNSRRIPGYTQTSKPATHFQMMTGLHARLMQIMVQTYLNEDSKPITVTKSSYHTTGRLKHQLTAMVQ